MSGFEVFENGVHACSLYIKDSFMQSAEKKRDRFHELEQAWDRVWQIVCCTQMEQSGSLH